MSVPVDNASPDGRDAPDREDSPRAADCTDSPDMRPASWSRPVALLGRVVAAIDDAADRLWSSRLNPLHQSGTIAIVAFAVLTVTGIYLFLFYSIDGPWESVRRIETEVPGGWWVRSVHTYAADLALVAIAVHALKMFLAGRFSKARARAWLSGLVLVGITLLCGWTGQVMAWDLQGQVVAVELTKLLDLLPLFSMPLGRAFDGLEDVPGSFFYMNLFLHVCLPLGMAVVLGLHLSRLARPTLLPPRALTGTITLLLAAVAIAMPVPLAAPANLLAIPRDVPVDLAYNFWLPAAWALGPAGHAALWALATAVAASVPWWWPRSRPQREPSRVDPDHCTGCTTCYQDCPFDAITMVPRDDPGRRSEFVALVNPDRCVACGICAGSCAPMSVGPPAHTGRMQLARERAFFGPGVIGSGDIVVLACRQSRVASDPRLAALPGLVQRPVECAGNLHTSVIDLALRRGAAGVFVLACPPRTAPCREGPKWLYERVYNDREAELPPRADKRRVAIACLSSGEWPQLAAALASFRKRLEALDDNPRGAGAGFASDGSAGGDADGDAGASAAASGAAAGVSRASGAADEDIPECEPKKVVRRA